jgi:hypothetical protein
MSAATLRIAGLRVPVGELLDVLRRHLLAVAVAQHRLEHDAQRHRKALDAGPAPGKLGKGIEGADLAGRCPESLAGVGERVRDGGFGVGLGLRLGSGHAVLLDRSFRGIVPPCDVMRAAARA